MVLVDSTVWIDHFNARQTPQVKWLQQALDEQSETLAIGDIILQEVLQGFRLQRHFALALDALSNVPCLQLGGTARCISAARNYRKLVSVQRNHVVFCVERVQTESRLEGEAEHGARSSEAGVLEQARSGVASERVEHQRVLPARGFEAKQL